MAMGKHYGSFGKGFADGLIAMMRLGMTMQLYKARAQYYKDRGWAATHPHGKAQTDAERQAEMDKAKNDPNYGRGATAEASGAAPKGGYSLQQMTEMAEKAGFKGDDAAHMAALARAESGGKPDAVGNAGEIGLTQINPHAWGVEMANSARDPQGAFNAAYKVYKAQGWGAWSTDPSSKNFTPNNNGMRFFNEARGYVGGGTKTAKGDTTAKPTTEKTTTAKAETVADKPTKEATAEAADIPASGGGFRIPGETGEGTGPGQATPIAAAPPPGSKIPPDPGAGPGAGAAQPPPGYKPPYANYPPSTSYPQPGPGIPSGPIDPSVIARQKTAQQLPQPRPNVGPTPSSVPAPPFESGYPAPDAAPMMPPRTTTPATAYPAGTIYGPPQPTAADKPAPAAQPVSAVTPRVTPADNSRFVAIDRPNADPTQRNRGSPQGTALNLASLWGANPPVAARGGGQAPSQAQSGPDLAQRVPLDRTPMPPIKPPDNFDDVASGIAMGSRKGGPIQRFANGGIPQRPTMRFQGGGHAQGSESYTPYTPGPPISSNSAVTGFTYNPVYSVGANLQQEKNQLLYGTTTPAPTADFGAAWGNLTPAQQNWMTQASTANTAAPYGSANYNQLNANLISTPAAATPAPAAATPAPAKIVQPTSTSTVAPVVDTTVTDPTSTTTTGTPGVNNAITAKSYDPNVDATTGAGFANTSNAGGTNYSVGTDDTLNQTTPGTISGSRKGGPIQRSVRGFANGGGIPARPTMRFATGGGAAASTLLSPNYSGPVAGGGWAGTPYADMSPNQQTWATQQQTLLGQERANANNPGWSGWSQLSGTPAAIWPTATPAAPTPIAEPAPTSTSTVAPVTDTTVTDPTSTTTTGAPGIPNAITANSYDPNVDATTGAGFANTSNAGGTNYSVGTDDTLNQTTPGTISGSRKGGPITRKLPKRVTKRYADGGMVDESGDVSASALGMPPGLAQGGQQPIPPYYYNPATYSASGAPVGKGVTQTSAPTFKAMAIPSLPMARGGIVGYDDGGEVDPGAGDMANLQNIEFADAREEADHPDAQPAAPPTTQYDASGAPTTDVDPGEFLHPADTGATGAQPTGGRDNSPPPDPMTPQVSDDAGNPSKGLIGAITSGLHWLAEHLGVGGAQAAQPAIAGDPQTQTARQQFATHDPNGATYISKQSVEELNDIADPEHQLQGNYRNIAGLEAGWRWAMAHGDTQNAGRLSAALLHYSVVTSQNLSQQARDSLYKGDLQKAVDYTNQALDAVPDGRNIRLTYDPKTNSVKVTGSTLTGQQLWEKYGSAPEVLERATSLGVQGKLQWDALESQAATYDHTFAGMQKARRDNMIAGGKEDADRAAQAQANKQITAMGPEYDDQTAPPTAPGSPPPALTPVSTPPAIPPTAAPSPGKSPDTTTAQTAAPPPSADSNVVAGLQPPAVSASPVLQQERGELAPAPSAPAGAPGGPGIQPGPTREAAAAPASTADVAAPAAQDVDLEHSVAYQNIVANTKPLYKTNDGRPIVGGVPMKRPPLIDEVTLGKYAPQVQAEYKARWQRYHDAEVETDKAMQADIDGQRRDLTADITSRRTTGAQAHSDEAAGKRTQAQIDAAALLERNRQADTEKKTQEGWTHEAEAPLTPTQRGETYKDTTPLAMTASLPRYAVYNSKGEIDPNASAQALGKAYDLPGKGGVGPATGGLQRATTVANIASDAVTWNTHMATGDVHDLVDGLARGVYKLDARPTPVTHHGQELDQFTVHQQEGDPGVTLFLPRQDGYRIARIAQDFTDAKPPTPTAASAGPAIPPAPPRAPSPTAGQGAPISPRAGAHPAPVTNAGETFLHGLLNPPPIQRGHSPAPAGYRPPQ